MKRSWPHDLRGTPFTQVILKLCNQGLDATIEQVFNLIKEFLFFFLIIEFSNFIIDLVMFQLDVNEETIEILKGLLWLS